MEPIVPLESINVVKMSEVNVPGSLSQILEDCNFPIKLDTKFTVKPRSSQYDNVHFDNTIFTESMKEEESAELKEWFGSMISKELVDFPVEMLKYDECLNLSHTNEDIALFSIKPSRSVKVDHATVFKNTLKVLSSAISGNNIGLGLLCARKLLLFPESMLFANNEVEIPKLMQFLEINSKHPAIIWRNGVLEKILSDNEHIESVEMLVKQSPFALAMLVCNYYYFNHEDYGLGDSSFLLECRTFGRGVGSNRTDTKCTPFRSSISTIHQTAALVQSMIEKIGQRVLAGDQNDPNPQIPETPMKKSTSNAQATFIPPSTKPRRRRRRTPARACKRKSSPTKQVPQNLFLTVTPKWSISSLMGICDSMSRNLDIIMRYVGNERMIGRFHDMFDDEDVYRFFLDPRLENCSSAVLKKCIFANIAHMAVCGIRTLKEVLDRVTNKTGGFSSMDMEPEFTVDIVALINDRLQNFKSIIAHCRIIAFWNVTNQHVFLAQFIDNVGNSGLKASDMPGFETFFKVITHKKVTNVLKMHFWRYMTTVHCDSKSFFSYPEGQSLQTLFESIINHCGIETHPRFSVTKTRPDVALSRPNDVTIGIAENALNEIYLFGLFLWEELVPNFKKNEVSLQIPIVNPIPFAKNNVKDKATENEEEDMDMDVDVDETAKDEPLWRLSFEAAVPNPSAYNVTPDGHSVTRITPTGVAKRNNLEKTSLFKCESLESHGGFSKTDKLTLVVSPYQYAPITRPEPCQVFCVPHGTDISEIDCGPESKAQFYCNDCSGFSYAKTHIIPIGSHCDGMNTFLDSLEDGSFYDVYVHLGEQLTLKATLQINQSHINKTDILSDLLNCAVVTTGLVRKRNTKRNPFQFQLLASFIIKITEEFNNVDTEPEERFMTKGLLNLYEPLMDMLDFLCRHSCVREAKWDAATIYAVGSFPEYVAEQNKDGTLVLYPPANEAAIDPKPFSDVFISENKFYACINGSFDQLSFYSTTRKGLCDTFVMKTYNECVIRGLASVIARTLCHLNNTLSDFTVQDGKQEIARFCEENGLDENKNDDGISLSILPECSDLLPGFHTSELGSVDLGNKFLYECKPFPISYGRFMSNIEVEAKLIKQMPKEELGGRPEWMESFPPAYEKQLLKSIGIGNRLLIRKFKWSDKLRRKFGTLCIRMCDLVSEAEDVFKNGTISAHFDKIRKIWLFAHKFVITNWEKFRTVEMKDDTRGKVLARFEAVIDTFNKFRINPSWAYDGILNSKGDISTMCTKIGTRILGQVHSRDPEDKVQFDILSHFMQTIRVEVQWKVLDAMTKMSNGYLLKDMNVDSDAEEMSDSYLNAVNKFIKSVIAACKDIKNEWTIAAKETKDRHPGTVGLNFIKALKIIKKNIWCTDVFEETFWLLAKEALPYFKDILKINAKNKTAAKIQSTIFGYVCQFTEQMIKLSGPRTPFFPQRIVSMRKDLELSEEDFPVPKIQQKWSHGDEKSIYFRKYMVLMCDSWRLHSRKFSDLQENVLPRALYDGSLVESLKYANSMVIKIAKTIFALPEYLSSLVQFLPVSCRGVTDIFVWLLPLLKPKSIKFIGSNDTIPNTGAEHLLLELSHLAGNLYSLHMCDVVSCDPHDWLCFPSRLFNNRMSLLRLIVNGRKKFCPKCDGYEEKKEKSAEQGEYYKNLFPSFEQSADMLDHITRLFRILHASKYWKNTMNRFITNGLNNVDWLLKFESKSSVLGPSDMFKIHDCLMAVGVLGGVMKFGSNKVNFPTLPFKHHVQVSQQKNSDDVDITDHIDNMARQQVACVPVKTRHLKNEKDSAIVAPRNFCRFDSNESRYLLWNNLTPDEADMAKIKGLGYKTLKQKDGYVTGRMNLSPCEPAPVAFGSITDKVLLSLMENCIKPLIQDFLTNEKRLNESVGSLESFEVNKHAQKAGLLPSIFCQTASDVGSVVKDSVLNVLKVQSFSILNSFFTAKPDLWNMYLTDDHLTMWQQLAIAGSGFVHEYEFGEELNWRLRAALLRVHAASKLAAQCMVTFRHDAIEFRKIFAENEKNKSSNEKKEEEEEDMEINESEDDQAPLEGIGKGVKKDEVSPALQSLLNMGLKEEHCKFALKNNDNDVQMAAEFLFSHSEEMLDELSKLELAPLDNSHTKPQRLIKIQDGLERLEVPLQLLTDLGFVKGGQVIIQQPDLALIKAEMENPTMRQIKPDDIGEMSPSTIKTLCGEIDTTERLVVTNGGISFASFAGNIEPLTSGLWYYEVRLFSSGICQIGWVDGGFVGDSSEGDGVGDCLHSWGFDGTRVRAWHCGAKAYGKRAKRGDTIGVYVDMDNLKMGFTLNGEDLGVVYKNFNFVRGLTPACSISHTEKIQINFGGPNRDFEFLKCLPKWEKFNPVALALSSTSLSDSLERESGPMSITMKYFNQRLSHPDMTHLANAEPVNLNLVNSNSQDDSDEDDDDDTPADPDRLARTAMIRGRSFDGSSGVSPHQTFAASGCNGHGIRSDNFFGLPSSVEALNDVSRANIRRFARLMIFNLMKNGAGLKNTSFVKKIFAPTDIIALTDRFGFNKQFCDEAKINSENSEQNKEEQMGEDNVPEKEDSNDKDKDTNQHEQHLIDFYTHDQLLLRILKLYGFREDEEKILAGETSGNHGVITKSRSINEMLLVGGQTSRWKQLEPILKRSVAEEIKECLLIGKEKNSLPRSKCAKRNPKTGLDTISDELPCPFLRLFLSAIENEILAATNDFWSDMDFLSEVSEHMDFLGVHEEASFYRAPSVKFASWLTAIILTVIKDSVSTGDQSIAFRALYHCGFRQLVSYWALGLKASSLSLKAISAKIINGLLLEFIPTNDLGRIEELLNLLPSVDRILMVAKCRIQNENSWNPLFSTFAQSFGELAVTLKICDGRLKQRSLSVSALDNNITDEDEENMDIDGVEESKNEDPNNLIESKQSEQEVPSENGLIPLLNNLNTTKSGSIALKCLADIVGRVLKNPHKPFAARTWRKMGTSSKTFAKLKPALPILEILGFKSRSKLPEVKLGLSPPDWASDSETSDKSKVEKTIKNIEKDKVEEEPIPELPKFGGTSINAGIASAFQEVVRAMTNVGGSNDGFFTRMLTEHFMSANGENSAFFDGDDDDDDIDDENIESDGYDEDDFIDDDDLTADNIKELGVMPSIEELTEMFGGDSDKAQTIFRSLEADRLIAEARDKAESESNVDKEESIDLDVVLNGDVMEVDEVDNNGESEDKDDETLNQDLELARRLSMEDATESIPMLPPSQSTKRNAEGNADRNTEPLFVSPVSRKRRRSNDDAKNNNNNDNENPDAIGEMDMDIEKESAFLSPKKAKKTSESHKSANEIKENSKAKLLKSLETAEETFQKLEEQQIESFKKAFEPFIITRVDEHKQDNYVMDVPNWKAFDIVAAWLKENNFKIGATPYTPLPLFSKLPGIASEEEIMFTGDLSHQDVIECEGYALATKDMVVGTHVIPLSDRLIARYGKSTIGSVIEVQRGYLVVKWDEDYSSAGREALYDSTRMKFEVRPVDINPKTREIICRYPTPKSKFTKRPYVIDSKFETGVILRLRGLFENGVRRCGYIEGELEYPDFNATIALDGWIGPEGISVVERELLIGKQNGDEWKLLFGVAEYCPNTEHYFSFESLDASCEGGSQYRVALGRVENINKRCAKRPDLGCHIGVDMDKDTVLSESTLKISAAELFHFCKDTHGGRVEVSEDGMKVTAKSSSLCRANVGFSSGVHYWEVQLNNALQPGDVTVGVMERLHSPGSSRRKDLFPLHESFRGWSFLNWRTFQSPQPQSHRVEQRAYGGEYTAGDVLGVLLDMDRGILRFTLDGLHYGEHHVRSFDIAATDIRGDAGGRKLGRVLYPYVGMRRGSCSFSLTKRFISTRGRDMGNSVQHLTNLQTILPSFAPLSSSLPSTVLEFESESRKDALESLVEGGFVHACKTRKIFPTRAEGVSVELDCSPESIAAAGYKFLPGDRVVVQVCNQQQMERSEIATILGVKGNRLWYRIISRQLTNIADSSILSGAWYWLPEEIALLGVEKEANRGFDDSKITHFADKSLQTFRELATDPQTWTIEADKALVAVVNHRLKDSIPLNLDVDVLLNAKVSTRV
eukprot:TRINITY_DN630_c0_g1_i9.p1 TRINITY_DN630_c0_g1~~TRINITY_DN630_c0_g1_i9.p1  ORF type:complete len:4087 (+),score=1268.81 TRINITY_DN630_c0_g1_i9:118-12378(+)